MVQRNIEMDEWTDRYTILYRSNNPYFKYLSLSSSLVVVVVVVVVAFQPLEMARKKMAKRPIKMLLIAKYEDQ